MRVARVGLVSYRPSRKSETRILKRDSKSTLSFSSPAPAISVSPAATCVGKEKRQEGREGSMGVGV